jgi:hypothetical protein
MKTFRFLFAAAILFCMPLGVFADEPAYILAKDFSADGKVLELDVPPELDGTRFYFVFQTDYTQPHVEIVLGRAGKHCYETRHLTEWQGTIRYVAVSWQEIKGRVKSPTLVDDLDMFFAPDPITLVNINLLSQHFVAGWSWTMCLLFVFIFFTVLFKAYKKKPGPVAMVLAFVVAMALLDLRIVADHAAIVYKEERLHIGMPPLTNAKIFADAAADVIGARPWSIGSVEIGGKLVEYLLAEHRYEPSGSPHRPALWITQHPEEGQVVFQSGKYYLVQKNQP